MSFPDDSMFVVLLEWNDLPCHVGVSDLRATSGHSRKTREVHRSGYLVSLLWLEAIFVPVRYIQ